MLKVKIYYYVLHSSIFYLYICNTNITIVMNIENTTAQMRKGILEFCILSLIAGRDLYSSDILEALKKGKMLVVEGTVYPLLTRLKNADLLQYRWEESTSGPPRKYYSITSKGETFLAELKSAWDELNKAVTSITKK
jgi:PadR family transcriptional regulator PadR